MFCRQKNSSKRKASDNEGNGAKRARAGRGTPTPPPGTPPPMSTANNDAENAAALEDNLLKCQEVLGALAAHNQMAAVQVKLVELLSDACSVSVACTQMGVPGCIRSLGR